MSEAVGGSDPEGGGSHGDHTSQAAYWVSNFCQVDGMILISQ